MNRQIFLFFILMFCEFAGAQIFKKEELKIALGAQYSSILQKRSMITYGSGQLIPIYSVNLFNPDILLAGSAIYFTKGITDSDWSYRLRYNMDASLDKPLYYSSEKEEDRIRREQSDELDFYLEYRTNNQSHIRLQISKDTRSHKGVYSELYAHYSAYDLIPGKNSRALMNLGFFGSLGGGSLAHNEYLYGNGSSDFRTTSLQYGVAVTSPSAIDVFWPTFKLTFFEILGRQNKNAAYVQEKSGWQIEALAAIRVF